MEKGFQESPVKIFNHKVHEVYEGQSKEKSKPFVFFAFLVVNRS